MSKKGGIKMKIADITYQSSMGEFINIEQASSQADILETLINNIKDSLLDSLYNCTTIENGGLDKESFILEGESILNDKANESKESFEILLESINNLKNKIIEDATKHRIEELTRYIQCLEERISEVEESIQNLDAQLRKVQTGTELTSITAEYQRLFDQKQELEKELDGGSVLMLGLRQKLEMAKTELNRINI